MCSIRMKSGNCVTSRTYFEMSGFVIGEVGTEHGCVSRQDRVGVYAEILLHATIDLVDIDGCTNDWGGGRWTARILSSGAFKPTP